MDRLCVVIYETSDSIRKTLHDVLVAHAIRQDAEVIIQWLKTPLAEKAICNACVEAQLAFVNAEDADKALLIGGLLHQTNPECRLVFYANAVPQEIADTVRYFAGLMPSRPIRFLHQPSFRDFSDTLSDFSAEAASQKHFLWENKGMKYRIPYGSIQYFRSDRNYVYLHLVSGSEYAFLGKLSGIEAQVPKALFIRVHQSYLVNRMEMLAVDKQKKTVLLRSGEEIYISKARYQETVEACV